MEDEALKLALALRDAEVIATRECFEFSLRALMVALGGCGAIRGQLVLALETSVREFRGDNLSLPAAQTLREDHLKLANVAYRDSIAANMEQLIRTIQRIGA